MILNQTPLRIYVNNPRRQAKRRWRRCSNQVLSKYIMNNLEKSKSQLQQDLLVSYIAENFPNHISKFFVEFGGTNGIELSNTYFLETSLEWKGIIAEPGKIWHRQLLENRKCSIDLRGVVGGIEKKMIFSEYDEPELSRIRPSNGAQLGSHISKSYEIETVSLEALLRFWNAPFSIGYLSMDTEGSELEILRNLDFDSYNFQIVTVEHNFLEQNSKGLQELMYSKGYIEIYPEVSEWEHWFLSESLHELMQLGSI